MKTASLIPTPPASPSNNNDNNNNSSENNIIIVGIWMNDSKYSKLPNLNIFNSDVYYKRIHTTKEAVSECNYILHKVLDKEIFLNEADLSQLSRKKFIIDPLDKVLLLSDRLATIQYITLFMENEFLKIPPTITLNRNDRNLKIDPLFFPAIAKPTSACSDPYSHTLYLVNSVDQIAQLPTNLEYILQKFIHHSHYLIKAYIIGDSLDLILKSSLSYETFNAKHSVSFDSQTLKLLSKPTTVDLANLIDYNLMHSFCMRLRDFLGLSIFGIDFLIEENTNDIFIIDVNYFPGFSGVDNLSRKINDLVISKITNGRYN